MSEETEPFGVAAAVILEPMCQTCGEDQHAAHEGHAFEKVPLPQLSEEYRQTSRVDRRVVDGDQQRLVLVLTGGPLHRRRTARVWDWRPGFGHADREPGPIAWVPLQTAAQALLARMLCPHTSHNVFCAVNRIVDSTPTEDNPLPEATGFHLDIRVTCRDCGDPFVFVGDALPVGMSPAYPTVDVAGTTLAAPVRPRSEESGFGLKRPGFQVRVR